MKRRQALTQQKEKESSGFGLFDRIYKTLWRGESKEEKEEREARERERDRRLLYGAGSSATQSR